MNNPAIVISAYTRTKSLERLFKSLTASKIPQRTTLVISIDLSTNNNQILDLCENFFWSFGEKKIIVHSEHLGLKKHVFSCFELTKTYGSIVLLEDDHYVSPLFYVFAVEVLNFYGDQNNIAGISLFSIQKNGFLHTPFHPLQEDNDIYFLQLAFSHGTVITSKQWNNFKSWLLKNNNVINESEKLHPQILKLHKSSNQEWFPIFTKYLVDNKSFFIYPRESFNINFQEKGTHFNKKSNWYQNSLVYERKFFRFKDFNSSLAIYDSFYELYPIIFHRFNNKINQYFFDVDLNATKSDKDFKNDFILTTHKFQKFLLSFDKSMIPFEQNVKENLSGHGIYLIERKSFKISKLKRFKTQMENYFHYNHKIGIITLFKYYFSRFI